MALAVPAMLRVQRPPGWQGRTAAARLAGGASMHGALPVAAPPSCCRYSLFPPACAAVPVKNAEDAPERNAGIQRVCTTHPWGCSGASRRRRRPPQQEHQCQASPHHRVERRVRVHEAAVTAAATPATIAAAMAAPTATATSAPIAAAAAIAVTAATLPSFAASSRPLPSLERCPPAQPGRKGMRPPSAPMRPCINAASAVRMPPCTRLWGTRIGPLARGVTRPAQPAGRGIAQSRQRRLDLRQRLQQRVARRRLRRGDPVLIEAAHRRRHVGAAPRRHRRRAMRCGRQPP
eukprot:362896-Chlamydomonas_euryale.AAC.3